MTILTPFCVCKPRDQEDLPPIQGILDTPMAQTLKLRAVAQRYFVSRGNSYEDGGPVLLVDGPDKDELTPISLSPQLPHAAPLSDEAREMIRAVTRIRLPASLLEEMIYVSSHQLWLFIMPRMIVMQADDISLEIRAAASLVRDIGNSTIARAAYATLRIPPPQSAHEHLAVFEAIPEALSIVAAFRAEAMADARAGGYDLGPISASDLQRAIEGG